MALTGAHAPGATPLTEENIRGLKLASITTRKPVGWVEALCLCKQRPFLIQSRIENWLARQQRHTRTA